MASSVVWTMEALVLRGQALNGQHCQPLSRNKMLWKGCFSARSLWRGDKRLTSPEGTRFYGEDCREHWRMSEEAARERALKDRRVGAGRDRVRDLGDPAARVPPGVTDRLCALPRTARKSQGCTWQNRPPPRDSSHGLPTGNRTPLRMHQESEARGISNSPQTTPSQDPEVCG